MSSPDGIPYEEQDMDKMPPELEDEELEKDVDFERFMKKEADEEIGREILEETKKTLDPEHE